uniref:Chemokine interleukin-8-like domain-containing protein n=1 Tax=Mola mola TaxID=94237 RepID=A0A3Q4ABM2_MOLML
MDLKVAIVIACLLAFTITSTEAVIPKCCIRTRKDIPVQLLQNVERWVMQRSDGACDIPALLIYVRNMRRPICGHPKALTFLTQLQQRMRNMKRRKAA